MVGVKKIRIIFLVVAIVIILLGVGKLLFDFFGEMTPEQIALAKTKGPKNAKIKIIEYTDFECPACAGAATLLDQYTKSFSDKIHVEYRSYPIISIHPNALGAAVYAECAARQKKFWQFHDKLFKDRTKWAKGKNKNGEWFFVEVAKGMGMDLKELDKCAHNEVIIDDVFAQRDKGKELGVSATPTYFINEKMVAGGRSLKRELDELLGIKGDNTQQIEYDSHKGHMHK